jgi:hypothetical protein
MLGLLGFYPRRKPKGFRYTRGPLARVAESMSFSSVHEREQPQRRTQKTSRFPLQAFAASSEQESFRSFTCSREKPPAHNAPGRGRATAILPQCVETRG